MESLLNPALIDAVSKIAPGTAFFIFCLTISYTLYKYMRDAAKTQQDMLEIIGNLTTALNGVKDAIQKTAESGERTAGQMVLVEKGLNDHTRLVVDTLDAFVQTFGSDIRFVRKLAESEFKQITSKLDDLKTVVDKLPTTDAIKTEFERVYNAVQEIRQTPPKAITSEVSAAILAIADKKPRVNGTAVITDESDKGVD